jgi:hypothetical protein
VEDASLERSTEHFEVAAELEEPMSKASSVEATLAVEADR